MRRTQIGIDLHHLTSKVQVTPADTCSTRLCFMSPLVLDNVVLILLLLLVLSALLVQRRCASCCRPWPSTHRMDCCR